MGGLTEKETFKYGNSWAVTLPPDFIRYWQDKLDADPEDKLKLEVSFNEELIIKVKGKKKNRNRY